VHQLYVARSVDVEQAIANDDPVQPGEEQSSASRSVGECGVRKEAECIAVLLRECEDLAQIGELLKRAAPRRYVLRGRPGHGE
jgi:hypothetical protein